MKIGNVMSRDVQVIKPDDTIRSAAALMKKIDAGLLPVTENEKLVGMITPRGRPHQLSKIGSVGELLFVGRGSPAALPWRAFPFLRANEPPKEDDARENVGVGAPLCRRSASHKAQSTYPRRSARGCLFSITSRPCRQSHHWAE